MQDSARCHAVPEPCFSPADRRPLAHEHVDLLRGSDEGQPRALRVELADERGDAGLTRRTIGLTAALSGQPSTRHCVAWRTLVTAMRGSCSMMTMGSNGLFMRQR
jgi:hypothetical protein